MSGDNPTMIKTPYLPQQPLLRIRHWWPSAGIGAMIENEQARPDALHQGSQLSRRRVMGAPIALPLSRDSVIGCLRIGFMNQHVTAVTMLRQRGRRRRIAGNDDHLVGRLKPKSERSQVAVPYRKGDDPNVAVGVDESGR